MIPREILKNPAHEDSCRPMTLTVRTINVFGFLSYLAFIGLLSTIGMPDKLHLSTVLILTPFPYFLICIATSFARRQSKTVLITGIIAHAVVMVAPIAALMVGSYSPAVLFIIYSASWFTMYFKLPLA